MPARPAETTTTSARGRGRITSCWLAERRPGIITVVIVIGIVGRPVITVIVPGESPVVIAVDLIASIVPCPGSIVGSRGPWPVCPLIAAGGGTGGQAIAIAGAIESPQMRIDSGSIIFGTSYDHAAAIIGIVEIRIVPAVPHKIAVPAHIWISKAKSKGRTKAKAQAISIGRKSVSISQTGAQARRIIGVVGAVIVKI
jgi:hypothetical protein